MNEEKLRLLDDRKKLHQRLKRVGYIPDEDMRAQIEQIIRVLDARIAELSDELMMAW